MNSPWILAAVRWGMAGTFLLAAAETAGAAEEPSPPAEAARPRPGVAPADSAVRIRDHAGDLLHVLWEIDTGG
jgi:hypothetical protein